MADLSKIDILLDDLTSIESQIAFLKKKYENLLEENTELKNQLKLLRKENVELSEKIDNLGNELEDIHDSTESRIFDSLNTKDRDELKLKLKELISKINYHLSANKQM